MERPYIVCHMMTSLDGKIMGNFFETPEATKAGEVFDNIIFGETPYYEVDAWMCGRVTTDDNFTFYKKPDLDEQAPPVPAGDFVVPKKERFFYVNVDGSGKLGWTENTIEYAGARAQVLEILTGKASNAYKAFLRKLNIPYIIAGEIDLDAVLAMKKLKDLFGIERLMLGGGGIINWTFLQAGLCDEVSLIITAAADGSMKTPSLFDAPEGLATDEPKRFELIDVAVKAGGSLWARYKVVNE
ncbi:MAG: RibD family protein [Veillonella caviae]|nr:RibD family protein [Veillonella caviae]